MDWHTFKEQHPLASEDQVVEDIIVTILVTRRQQGLTQAQLAKKIGMSQSQLAKIETLETTPKIDTLLRILNGLGITLSLTPPKVNH